MGIRHPYLLLAGVIALLVVIAMAWLVIPAVSGVDPSAFPDTVLATLWVGTACHLALSALVLVASLRVRPTLRLRAPAAILALGLALALFETAKTFATQGPELGFATSVLLATMAGDLVIAILAILGPGLKTGGAPAQRKRR